MLGAGHALLCIPLAVCLPRAVAVGGSSRGHPCSTLAPLLWELWGLGRHGLGWAT